MEERDHLEAVTDELERMVRADSDDGLVAALLDMAVEVVALGRRLDALEAGYPPPHTGGRYTWRCFEHRGNR